MKLDNIKIVKIISIFIAIIAIMVIIGWIFDIPLLRTVIPNVISMRFLTAICFLGVSILLYSMTKFTKRNNISTIYLFTLTISSFFILFLMLVSIFNILGVNFNMEEMINYNYVDHSKTFPISVPSISTMFNFILIGLVGLFNIFSLNHSKKITKVVGFIISIIALSVLIGYIFGIPLMYFAIPGISNAMAIHTCILFLLIGLSFILLNNNNNNNNFNNSYSIKQKLILGFSVLIILIILLIGITTIIINENNTNLKLIKEVEAPLEVMVEQVIGYDAMLTGNVHWALIDAINNENEEVLERKEKYDEIGAKLDHLLKYDAIELLKKSRRGNEDKELVFKYLNELDRINLALVELELDAFKAIERKDYKTAFFLVSEGKYYIYKKELADYYQKWADEERKINSLYKDKNLTNLKYIFYANLILGLFIIIIGIILTKIIIDSIVKPLSKLDNIAKEISSGNLNVKISSESKKIPGIIGNVANSFNRLIESSQFALKTLVESKMSKKDFTLFTSSRDAIMTLEPPTWNFTSGNPAAIKMFNTKNEKEFTSHPPWEYSPKYQADGKLSKIKAKEMINKAMKEGTNFFEWTHRRYKGKDFPATVLLSRIKENGKTYLQATVRDQTKEIILLNKNKR